MIIDRTGIKFFGGFILFICALVIALGVTSMALMLLARALGLGA